MKVTGVQAYPLTYVVHAVKGDSISVTHSIEREGEITVSNKVFEKQIEEDATFSHSILFWLDGEMQWMLGTQKTIDWLNSLLES